MNLTALGRWMMRMVLGNGSDSEPMTVQQALTYPPVWNCVNKICGAFAIMPLNVHRERGREKSIQTTHPVYSLLRWRPNGFQPPNVFKRQLMLHALMLGNGRAYIHRENGIPVELIPLMPDRTDTMLINGEKWHGTILEQDSRVGLWRKLPPELESKVTYFTDDEVLHIPGLGYDGVKGYSLLSLARRSWGLGIGSEKHMQTQQKKGYAGGLMLEAPPGAFRSERDAQEFLENFRKNHEGTENAGKAGLLRENVKANVLTMNNADAQFIEHRRFQREDAALMFCLEGILGDSSNASYNSLEQRNIAYRTNCLAPWTTTWEEECELKLLTESERRRGYYMKFNDGALFRTEKAVTMAFISQGITSRVISPNEGRSMLDMNPYEGGDVFSNPAIDKVTPNGTTESKAAMAMLSNLLSVECTRVKQAAKKPDKFFSKLDAFYGDWERKLADAIEQIGGDRDIATRHCAESKSRLLDASECKPEELIESIDRTVHDWPNRVHALIEELYCVES